MVAFSVRAYGFIQVCVPSVGGPGGAMVEGAAATLTA
jgi:hypothetical protein